MQSNILAAIVVVAIVAPPRWAVTQETVRFSDVQASFEPPVNFVTNEATYVFATGITAFADPLRLYGAALGFGRGLGSGPRPRWGFEAAFVGIKGGGDLPTALPVEYGGPTLHLDMVQTLGSFTMKLRAVDPGDDGWLGLTGYAGVQLGMHQLGMTNALGTAYRHYVLGGGGGGAIAQIFGRPWVDFMFFGGGRAVGIAGLPETGDPEAPPGQLTFTPEVGGNVTVHLPRGIDVSLSTLVNWLTRDDDRQSAKVFVLGIGWRAGAGFSPVVEGDAP